jgi:predicted DNA-binding protein
MVEVQFEPEVEERVRKLASEQHISEAFLIQEVVTRWIEDRADYAAGIRSLAQMKYTISQEEMERRSNVAD